MQFLQNYACIKCFCFLIKSSNINFFGLLVAFSCVPDNANANLESNTIKMRRFNIYN